MQLICSQWLHAAAANSTVRNLIGRTKTRKSPGGNTVNERQSQAGAQILGAMWLTYTAQRYVGRNKQEKWIRGETKDVNGPLVADQEMKTPEKAELSLQKVMSAEEYQNIDADVDGLH